MPEEKEISLLTVCSGIGSPELGAGRVWDNVRVLGACEIDSYARETYLANFDIKTEDYHKDITKMDASKYKNKVDLFVGGFPCQAFSTAGKKLGFEDTRGTIFYDVARTIKESQPSVFILENVEGLVSHEKIKDEIKETKEINLFGEEIITKKTIKSVKLYSKLNKGVEIGKTLKVIEEVLIELGYFIKWDLLNSKDFGIPQSRKRIFIVGFKREEDFKDFRFPMRKELKTTINDYLVPENSVDPKMILTPQQIKATMNSTYSVTRDKFYLSDGIIGTLNARDYKDPKCVIINSVSGKRKGGVEDEIRKLTPREYLRLQGFSDGFKQVVSNSQMYKQVGNSMTIHLMQYLFTEVSKATKRFKKDG